MSAGITAFFKDENKDLDEKPGILARRCGEEVAGGRRRSPDSSWVTPTMGIRVPEVFSDPHWLLTRNSRAVQALIIDTSSLRRVRWKQLR
jgi:hypothetical protein